MASSNLDDVSADDYVDVWSVRSRQVLKAKNWSGDTKSKGPLTLLSQGLP